MNISYKCTPEEHALLETALQALLDITTVSSEHIMLSIEVVTAILDTTDPILGMPTGTYSGCGNHQTIKIRKGQPKQLVTTLIHEFSHLLSHLARTRTYRTYDSKKNWFNREEEQKAVLETDILGQYVRAATTRMPRSKKDKIKKRLLRVWNEYKNTKYQCFA